MGDLTPFQNQVLDLAEKKEAEEQKRKREEMREQQGGGGGHGRPRNARSGGNSGSSPGSKMEQEETVRYVNEELNPDHEIHDSD